MTSSSVLSPIPGGSLRLISSWGSDEGIIESARMSTGKGFQGWGPLPCPACGSSGDPNGCWDHKPAPGDERLLAHLWRNAHTTPFEMAGATFEIEAPIFVFREWHRHRTQSYNELSSRYTPLPDHNYFPSPAGVLKRARAQTPNKQAQGTTPNPQGVSDEDVESWLQYVEHAYTQAQEAYAFGLSLGIPKELARIVVPVGRFSRMRASANLLNWTRFLRLRCPSNAQYEIRQYAWALVDLLQPLFPRTLALLVDELPVRT